jgi:antitoxin component YwqK of YwqJK toxin-antitoxin module
MKKLLSLLSILLIISCSDGLKEISEYKLVERNGITYEVNSNKPFTGIGIFEETEYVNFSKTYYEEGKVIGFEEFHSNGNLYTKHFDSPLVFEMYSYDGQLEIKTLEDFYESYYWNGQLKIRRIKDSWESYFNNGQLRDTGLCINEQRIGLWKTYNVNGDLVESKEYKNNEKQKCYFE